MNTRASLTRETLGTEKIPFSYELQVEDFKECCNHYLVNVCPKTGNTAEALRRTLIKTLTADHREIELQLVCFVIKNSGIIQWSLHNVKEGLLIETANCQFFKRDFDIPLGNLSMLNNLYIGSRQSANLGTTPIHNPMLNNRSLIAKHGTTAIAGQIDNYLDDGNLAIKFEGVIKLFNVVKDSSSDMATGDVNSKEVSGIALPWMGEAEFMIDYTDIALLCGSKEFQCHKVILASRSEVLRERLKELLPKEVLRLDNIEENAFETFLKFLYTGMIEDMEENAQEMLKLGSIYQVHDLKSKCSDYLRQTLTVDNVNELFVLAHIHEAADLEKQALNFALDNPGTLDEESLVKNYPQLVWKVTVALHEKMKLGK